VRVYDGRLTRSDLSLEAFEFELILLDEQQKLVDDATPLAANMSRERVGQAVARRLGPGKFRMTTWGRGEHILKAESATAGLGQSTVTVEAHAEEQFSLVLSRGVLCAGRVQLVDSTVSGTYYLSARATGIRPSAQATVNLVNGVGSFELIGLWPGNYSGVFAGAEGTPLTIEFTLPEGGNGELQIYPEK
jgi:hypothetical protein